MSFGTLTHYWTLQPNSSRVCWRCHKPSLSLAPLVSSHATVHICYLYPLHSMLPLRLKLSATASSVRHSSTLVKIRIHPIVFTRRTVPLLLLLIVTLLAHSVNLLTHWILQIHRIYHPCSRTLLPSPWLPFCIPLSRPFVHYCWLFFVL